MALSLPENIAALTRPTRNDLPALNAWASAVHPDISITFAEERVAPPRRPGESIEGARARDPGPDQLVVRVVAARDGKPATRRVTLINNPVTFDAGVLARVEMASLTAQQQQAVREHTLSDEVLLSGYSDDDLAAIAAADVPNGSRSWDYPDATAKYLDLSGTLCAESVGNPDFIAREQRLAELREILRADWRGELVRAVESALVVATTVTAGRGQAASLRAAAERVRASRPQ